MNRKAAMVCLMMAFIGGAIAVHAQDADTAPPPDALDDPQLDQITGPIALYPDPLVAQILPAATQPSQIAIAYNYVSQGGDPAGIDSQSWDDSVKAVAHYPDVLKMMDADLSWTTQLGDAFVNQPSDVMNSIQRLRLQAQELGNLQSSPDEDVESDNGDIEILPANPDMIYVPIYDPGMVYYQRPYGRDFISYGPGYGVGIWLNHDFDWHGHNVVVWDRDHPRPANYWHERPEARREVISRASAWQPPAGRAIAVQRRPMVVNRVDRGYEARPVARAGEVRSSVEVHTIPARPTVRENVGHVNESVATRVSAPRPSAFIGAHTAVETRAASSRGVESRAAMGGGAPHAAPGGGGGASHPAPSGGGGGARPSGGGGGGSGKR